MSEMLDSSSSAAGSILILQRQDRHDTSPHPEWAVEHAEQGDQQQKMTASDELGGAHPDLTQTEDGEQDSAGLEPTPAQHSAEEQAPEGTGTAPAPPSMPEASMTSALTAGAAVEAAASAVPEEGDAVEEAGSPGRWVQLAANASAEDAPAEPDNGVWPQKPEDAPVVRHGDAEEPAHAAAEGTMGDEPAWDAAAEDDGGFGGSDDGFGDFEEADEFVAAAAGPASSHAAEQGPAAGPAPTDEGFPAFAEATREASSPQHHVRSSDGAAPPAAASQGAAPSQPLTELFSAGKPQYLSLVRSMLLPPGDHAGAQSNAEGSLGPGQPPTLEGLASGSASSVAPVAWEGSRAQARFLSRLRGSAALSMEAAHMQGATGVAAGGSAAPEAVRGPGDEPAALPGSADIFAASGSVLDGDCIGSGTGKLRESPRWESGEAAWHGEGLAAEGDGWHAGEPAQAAQAANGHEAAAAENGGPYMHMWAADSPLWSQESAAKAQLSRRSGSRTPRSLRRSSSTSPSRLARSSRAEAGPGEPPVARKASGHIVLPDLSFMLSDKLVVASPQPSRRDSQL